MKSLIVKCVPLQSLFVLFTWTIAIGQPNFVIIVLDDQGWTDTSTKMDTNILESMSDYHQTPNIASIASSGMTFSQGYASAPKCSPSRCSILTGRTTARNKFTNTDNRAATNKLLIEADTETTLNSENITYAEWLKSTDLNYRTAHFGKWHLGNTSDSSPGSNGFDFNDGNTSNDDGNHSGTVQEDPKNIFDLTTRSIEFIENAIADGVRFAIQISHYAVHSDIEARQATIDLYNDPSQRPMGTRHDHAEYAAMTEDTDDGIGLLLDKITSLGIHDNTYIFFISDNGGSSNLTNNTPLSRGKTFIYEGGIRVPFIVKGPGVIANSYSVDAVVEYDIFPTIADLTGSNVALPDSIDGQSIVPLLKGETFERNAPIFFHSPHYESNASKTPRSAIVSGTIKLIVEYETGNTYLFDLEEDIEEEKDLSTSESHLKLNLLVLLRDHLKNVGANMPSLDPSHSSFSGSGSDIDEDGLDDEWEFREMLSYTYDADDDPDQDGISNLQEYNNGLDPLVMDSGQPVLSTDLIENSFTIYPNPSNGMAHIALMNHFGKEMVESTLVFDHMGRVLYYNDQYKSKIDLNSIAPGMYFMQISTSKTQVIKRFVIQ